MAWCRVLVDLDAMDCQVSTLGLIAPLLLLYGLRRGEVLGLAWADVDADTIRFASRCSASADSSAWGWSAHGGRA